MKCTDKKRLKKKKKKETEKPDNCKKQTENAETGKK